MSNKHCLYNHKFTADYLTVKCHIYNRHNNKMSYSTLNVPYKVPHVHTYYTVSNITPKMNQLQFIVILITLNSSVLLIH